MKTFGLLTAVAVAFAGTVLAQDTPVDPPVDPPINASFFPTCSRNAVVNRFITNPHGCTGAIPERLPCLCATEFFVQESIVAADDLCEDRADRDLTRDLMVRWCAQNGVNVRIQTRDPDVDVAFGFLLKCSQCIPLTEAGCGANWPCVCQNKEWIQETSYCGYETCSEVLYARSRSDMTRFCAQSNVDIADYFLPGPRGGDSTTTIATTAETTTTDVTSTTEAPEPCETLDIPPVPPGDISIATFPTCALICLLGAIPDTGCVDMDVDVDPSKWDFNCMCSNTGFVNYSWDCINEKCNVKAERDTGIGAAIGLCEQRGKVDIIPSLPHPQCSTTTTTTAVTTTTEEPQPPCETLDIPPVPPGDIAIGTFPGCSLTCLLGAIPDTGCVPDGTPLPDMDFNCMCSNSGFVNFVWDCINEKCTLKEQRDLAIGAAIGLCEQRGEVDIIPSLPHPDCSTTTTTAVETTTTTTDSEETTTTTEETSTTTTEEPLPCETLDIPPVPPGDISIGTFPGCSLSCLLGAIPDTGCVPDGTPLPDMDFNCMCSNNGFVNFVWDCINEKCTIKEQRDLAIGAAIGLCEQRGKVDIIPSLPHPQCPTGTETVTSTPTTKPTTKPTTTTADTTVTETEPCTTTTLTTTTKPPTPCETGKQCPGEPGSGGPGGDGPGSGGPGGDGPGSGGPGGDGPGSGGPGGDGPGSGGPGGVDEPPVEALAGKVGGSLFAVFAGVAAVLAF